MTAAAFDPLAAVQALEAAGIVRKHAEAHAAQLRAVANAVLDRLATRADLDLLRGEFDSLRGEFDSLRKEFDSLRREFDSLRREFDSLRRELRYGMGIMSAINLVILGRLFGVL